MEQRIFNLAENFYTLTEAKNVPKLIHEARISYLKIGIGSEISCMINPTVCWIANTRTIWTHLLLKHNGNYARADEELSLYRDEDENSEMAYKKWAAIHADMGSSMHAIASEGQILAGSSAIGPGVLTYLWADAIANQLYADQYE